MITCAKPVLRDNQKMGNQILEARRVPEYTPKQGDRNSDSILSTSRATTPPGALSFEEQRLIFSRFEGRGK
jgi:hypothetical protein